MGPPYFFNGMHDMTSYSIRHNSKVYIVKDNLRYELQVYPNLSFSQTFEETGHSVKTLHTQLDMFEDASVTKANPASFSFTVLIDTGGDFTVLRNWLIDTVKNTSDEALVAYDVYVDTGVHIFKLTKGILTNATFQIGKSELITVSLTGQATKLEIVPALVGIPQARTKANTFIPRVVEVLVDGVLQDNLMSISIEFENSINWLGYQTLHKSLYVTSPEDTQYPEAFVVSSRSLTGTIRRYLTETATHALDWKRGVPLEIRINDGTADRLTFDIPSVVLTNTPMPDEVYTTVDTFRMIVSPGNLANVIKL